MPKGIKIDPRLLTKKQAAIYCGISPALLDGVVKVQPIKLCPKRPRLDRYDVRDLDEFIDNLKGTSGNSADVWLEKVGRDNSREGN